MLKNLLSIKLISIFSFFVLGITFGVSAQTVVSGTIKDAANSEPLVGVSVQIKGKVIGTITDVKGKFEFTTSTPIPFTLLVTSIGYKSEEIEVKSANAAINVSLQEQEVLGQEVVVSASRFEEKVMRSPVTVEKLDLRAIRETTAPNFYDAIGQMKGIDMTTQGLLFKSLNMRGFGSTGNPRTVQMIDGMDNQAPGLNFPVDNIVGMPELDVESVEILPGAASALYGPNAINGLILMNSKSPFLYQGLSAQIKSGIMSESSRATASTPFYDLNLRFAKAINNKFAYKFNVGYIGAQDWQGTNYANLNRGGVENGGRGAGVDPDYDGINIYGDEVQANMRTVANGLVTAGLLPSAALGIIPDAAVSRTGFIESDLLDFNTKSLKLNAAAHYRVSEKVELIGQVNYGYGTTAYTGTGRYSLRGFNLSQIKLELKGSNFNVRAYTTQERSGSSFNAGLQAVSMLNEIKPHATWFGQYVGAFAQAKGAGRSDAEAHLAARGLADTGMPASGSDALGKLADKYADLPIINGGAGFLDKTNMYHIEGIYNFNEKIKFMDLSVGGNLRQYQLRSDGTLFSDNKEGRSGTIGIGEFGGFVQAGKSLFNDHFKLSASLRYDKNENFDGQFTPRIAGVFTFGNHNFRMSYQSGFRIPTTQNQYIDLKTAAGTLIGGLPEFDKRYNLANGISVADLSPANIAKYIDASVQETAKAYATAAVTAQATPLITAGVNAAIKDLVTKGVTAAITKQVTDGVTAAITQQVTAGVTAAITKQVTDGVTAAITKQVTDLVTAAVNQQVSAGLLDAAAAAAAIQAGVAAQLPSVLTANLKTEVDKILPGAITANLKSEVEKALPGALTANLSKEVDKVLPGALTANLKNEVDKALPAALQDNFKTAFDAELAKALAANVPGVTAQVIPAYALQKVPKYQAKALQPERIQSYEIGYKGLFGKKFFVDAYSYWSKYSNFIGGTSVVVPTAPAGPGLPIESGVAGASTRLAYSRPSNTGAEIRVKGWAANVNYSLGKGYSVGGNMAFNKLVSTTISDVKYDGFKATPEQQYAGFNTPEYRYNLTFGKRMGSGDKFGFNLNFRHQDSFLWESSFVVPTTPTETSNPFQNTKVPSINNIDAQVSIKLTSAKSILKIGATNLGGNPYFQAFGSAIVGSTYYVSISYDDLFQK